MVRFAGITMAGNFSNVPVAKTPEEHRADILDSLQRATDRLRDLRDKPLFLEPQPHIISPAMWCEWRGWNIIDENGCYTHPSVWTGPFADKK